VNKVGFFIFYLIFQFYLTSLNFVVHGTHYFYDLFSPKIFSFTLIFYIFFTNFQNFEFGSVSFC
jgi:hypothetical protein